MSAAVTDLEKIKSRLTHLKFNITEPDRARNYFIKIFNKLGLEFISVRQDYTTYTMVVIKFKDTPINNTENSLFKKEIIAQTQHRTCSRAPFKISVPLYYEIEYEPEVNFVLWYNNEKYPANAFDTSLIIAIETMRYES